MGNPALFRLLRSVQALSAVSLVKLAAFD